MKLVSGVTHMTSLFDVVEDYVIAIYIPTIKHNNKINIGPNYWRIDRLRVADKIDDGLIWYNMVIIIIKKCRWKMWYSSPKKKNQTDYLYYEEVYNYIGFQTNW